MIELSTILVPFLFIIAVVIGILSPLVAIATIYSASIYDGSLTEIGDMLKGVTRTFHPMKFIIASVISWAWIAVNVLAYVDKLDLF
jgi:hypothetical protein